MGGSALLLATLVLSGCGQDDASTSSNGTTSTSSEGPALESTVVSEDGSLGLAPVFEDVSQPMSTITRPGTESTYISTRDGFVLRVGPDAQQEVVLDLSDEVASTEGESGMYDIEFSPDGDWLYVSLCAKGGGSYNASYRVYAFAMVDGAPDESSRVDVLHVGDLGEAHNGGQIEFGPDGMLYLSLGDGGELSFTESQDLSDLRGKIVRLEVSGNPPTFSAPPDNPFTQRAGALPEIWSYGLRNPWGFSFDSATDDLWITDVGERSAEEINRLPGPDAGRGLNFGWAALEGDEPFNEDLPLREPYHPPEFITPHDSGRCALIGGSVYRGTALPELVGDYLFLDYCEARLLSLHRNEDGDYEERDLGLEFPPDSFVSMFSTTPDGEILISSLGRSTVYELVPGGGT